MQNIKTIKIPTIMLLLTLSISAISQAANITPGEKLPSLSIAKDGLCVINNNDVTFEPWHSDSLKNKLHVIEYLAARAGIDKVHQQFYQRLKAADLPPNALAIVKLVNANDAMWGTSRLIAPEIKKTKLNEPETEFVVDAEGAVQKLWDLEKKNSSITLLDKTGTVLFFQQGNMTAKEISMAIDLIQAHLPE